MSSSSRQSVFGEGATSSTFLFTQGGQAVTEYPARIVGAAVHSHESLAQILALRDVKAMSTVMREVLEEQRRTREQQEKTNALLEQLISSMTAGDVASHIVDLREISDEDARDEISRLFNSADADLYYSDICDQTQLPLEQVVRVCNQLMSEGRIGVAQGV